MDTNWEVASWLRGEIDEVIFRLTKDDDDDDVDVDVDDDDYTDDGAGSAVDLNIIEFAGGTSLIVFWKDLELFFY